MLIGIDGNEANIKERVGVNVWAAEILKRISDRLTKQPNNRITGDDVVVYLARNPVPDLPPKADRWQYRIVPDAPLWTRWRLPLDLYLHRPRPDVFLSLSHYIPAFAPMPRIVSIMDLSFLKFPEAFKPMVRWQLEHWTEESVKNAVHVLTISEFTKKEIVRAYAYPKEAITVVYPGVSEVFTAFKGLSLDAQGQSLRNVRRKFGITGKYLLSIGTLQPKKNLPRLLEAFRLIIKDFPDLQLIIAGKIWHQFSDHEQRTMNYERVKFLGFVPDSDLPPLLAGAECLVLPSLYEGFGIPILEAMAMGTPVAASNATSIPEVVDGGGVLFDPTSVPDIARGIREVLSWSPKKRHEQVKKGMIRAGKFDWEISAAKLMGVMTGVLETKR